MCTKLELTKYVDTEEGLDKLMSLNYYSRMRCIIKLLPLLLASPLPAHAITICTAGFEAKLIPDDLSLRRPENYGFVNRRSHLTYMTTFFHEALAKKYPGKLSLSHVYPSFVMTPGFTKEGVAPWFKTVWTWFAGPILRVFALSPEDCGDRNLFVATARFAAAGQGEASNQQPGDVDVAFGTDGMRGSGSYSVNWNGETIDIAKAYEKFDKEELGRKVYDHTMKAFATIEAGDVFKG